MNTPAHAALNLLVLGRTERDALPVAIGAIAPDLPMLVFYAWERLVRGVPESAIWSQRYFDPGWQTVFDTSHSIPLLLIGLALVYVTSRVAGRTGQSGPQRFIGLFLGSMVIHALADLPLHREDAHRHFFPLSDWRFVSPVSYWDPRHFGVYAGIGEIVLVVGASIFLYRRYRGRGRWIIGVLGAVYALFVLFAISAWSGMIG